MSKSYFHVIHIYIVDLKLKNTSECVLCNCSVGGLNSNCDIYIDLNYKRRKQVW